MASNDKEIKRINQIFNIYLIFIMLQPFFDIISNLSNNDIIKINIITYIKPLFVIGILFYLIFFIKYKNKKKDVLYLASIAIYTLLHSYLLYYIYVDKSTIIHELRFIINIIYFIIIILTLKNIYTLYKEKEYFYNKLKKTLIITIIIYSILYLLAVITNTSWLTYEFSDANKMGYRGWYYSGQILGHLISISLPIFVYQIFKSKINVILKVLSISIISITLCLLGTKVPYFILLIILLSYILANVFYKLINKKHKLVLWEYLLCILLLSVALISYKKLPVYHNTEINNAVASIESSEEDLKKYSKDMERISKENKNKIGANNGVHKVALEYEEWTLKSLEKLNNLYASGKLHSSNNRNRQLYFMHYKFVYSDFTFKLLGLGYLNQPNYLSMERDIIMPLYSFGIIGFILFTALLWLLLFKTIVVLLKNIKKLDIETIFLVESFLMFFFISFYSGYTYIYTQFSIILSIIMTLLYIKLITLRNTNESIKALRIVTTDIYNEVATKLENNIKNKKKTFIITANPETIKLAKTDEEIKNMIFNKNNLIVPDGIAIVKGCRMLGMNINERITGCDLCSTLLELANKHKKSLYLYGAKEEVINALVKKINDNYPNINIVGTKNGYNKNIEKIKEDIIVKEPDICLVALGIPKQEKIINDIIDKVNKGIYMGVGGSFDVLSGFKKRAPKIFIKLNLEWLYRITTEPKRLLRFIKNNMNFLLDLL